MQVKTLISLSQAEMRSQARKLGSTPLKPIEVVIHGQPRTLHLKLESHNPTGSVKDRTAFGLLQVLEEQGRLRKGSCLVESTSGNLGVALAFLCKLRGYDFIAVVDPKTTAENIARIRALGGQIELVTQPDVYGGYLLSRLERVRELCQRSSRYVWSNQYGSPANPAMHKETTGPEIYRQMYGQIDAVFIAVSTGGTLAGISEYLRVTSPATRVIAVDACGSVVFAASPTPRKLTGIGASQPSQFLRPEHYDAFRLVTDSQAFAWCRILDDELGLRVGGSSGAVLSACVCYLAQHPYLKRVVCLCPDDGEHYATSIFNDAWLEEHHLHLGPEALGPIDGIGLVSRARAA